MCAGRRSDPTLDEIAAARALLVSTGAEVRVPHSSTVRRRERRSHRTIAVISRSGRSYRKVDGRVYGEVSPEEQRQSDAGPWRVNSAIREQLLPLTIAVGGVVQRIYEVKGWDRMGVKWYADLGRELTSADLDRDYPGFPYRVGDDCPTAGSGAYRPETY